MSPNNLSDGEVIKRLDCFERNIEFLEDYEITEMRQLKEIALMRGLIADHLDDLRRYRENWE